MNACLSVRAQSDRSIRVKAEEAMRNKDWFGAAQYYNRLHNHDSSDIKIRYAYADASRLNFDLDLAQRLYGKVIAEDNGRKYPLSFYWMGQLLKTKGQYKEAKKWFTKFSKTRSKHKRPEREYYITKSRIEIDACDLAQILIKNPVIPPPEHLDTVINSKVSEYAAFEKDSTLFFSSLRNSKKKDANAMNYSKIYRSDMKNQRWRKAKELDTLYNSTYLHTANTCFSPDYKQMIISRCQSKNASEYTCDLYVSVYINKRWQPFLKMEEPINQPGFSTSQANFGIRDGKTVLFFTSNRPGGKGEMDIWYSVKNSDGSFETPMNAGEKINTPDNEITPWYVNSQNTLFFSSTWHKGLGGFDIFKSQSDSSGFLEPQNAGFPINTSYNDIYYSVNKGGNRVYLSSNRLGSYFENKLNCCNDIYRFQVDTSKASPQAVVIDSMELTKGRLRLLVPLTLYFHNDEPDPKTKNTTTALSYDVTYTHYKALLKEYKCEYIRGLSGDEKEAAGYKIENFFADSVDAGMEDLQKFANLLESVLAKGEQVTITMKGYCSPLASTDYNINLAKRRISSLRNYLMQTHNGVFVKYIDSKTEGQGSLIFEDVDVGELPASSVSDDYKDKRNSVYSPFAASERKIQVIAISFSK